MASTESPHCDSTAGLVKSQTRAGTPAIVSPIRPLNVDVAVTPDPEIEAPPRRTWTRFISMRGRQVARAPTDHVVSDPSRGLKSSGTGPSRSRSMMIADEASRSLLWLRRATLLNRVHTAWVALCSQAI